MAIGAVGDWRRAILGASVIGSVVFNFLLCFVNTNVFRTNATVVMAAEAALIGAALLTTLGKSFDLIAFMVVFLGYMLFLGALQGKFDPKPARDILIPVVFYVAALRNGDAPTGDKLVFTVVAITLVVGIIEYAFLKQYTKLFDILGYYVSRGTVQAAAAELSDDRLFASGMRYEGRTLAPFLGEHRVSSIFLEPVSVGNFGAICFSWIALRNWGHPRRMFVRLLPVLTIFTLADARFGLTISLLSLVVFAGARFATRPLLLATPLLMLVVLAAIGFLYPDVAWDNTTRGRILLSGQMLSKMDFEEVFALVYTDRFMSDSGYVYTLAKFGLVGFICIWALFCFLPARNETSWRYRVFMGVYVTMLLIVSNSIYSIKTAALAFYLLGALDAPQRKHLAREENIDQTDQPQRRPKQRASRPLRRPRAA